MSLYYKSTRNSEIRVSASEAILTGLAPDGGLFVPERIPALDVPLKELKGMSYQEIAYAVMKQFLTDFTEEELKECIQKAYDGKFDTEEIAPLVKAGDIYYLELFHGATIAFKDMALSVLPHLLTVSAKKNQVDRRIVILTATSGDTGKAALAGFADVEGTQIIVFYPKNGVSRVQELQMVTQKGCNVDVVAIHGNFDDAQSAVKSIFTNADIKKQLAEKNMMFSSANSINWGRLVPQIVYYFSAYCDMLSMGRIKAGEPVNIVVPTGNFGNILAAYYAKQMGVPLKTLVCASNTNNVLTDFLKTGTYDRNRAFYATTSPSMDILISSNLERLLYHMSGEDDKLVSALMQQLASDGKYTVSDALLKRIQAVFDAGFTAEESVNETINKHFSEYKYLCDTHTAVALNVYDEYVKATGDDIPTVIDSTASPYKFSKSVLTAVCGENASGLNEFEMVDELNRVSGAEVPVSIANLKNKEIRFTDVCNKENMSEMVFRLLDL